MLRPRSSFVAAALAVLPLALASLSPLPPILPAAHAARVEIADIRKSLVRITTTAQEPDYKVPWNPGHIVRGVGAGFFIGNQRLMTNAHVISNARFITVEREGDPKKYQASVQFVGHDCDLAVLTVADAHFYDGLKPMEFGGIPQLESSVAAYGYPIGGERLSVTEGIVSRVDFQPYTHSSIDSHLAIQISAPINPGNSGGPVLQDGKVVGVAFQGYSGDVAQNTAYMIATPVIQHFLQDIEDGHYDRYVDLALTKMKLLNPSQRAALGLGPEQEDQGVMVGSVVPGGSSDGVLKVGDVILAVDGNAVASDGFIEINGERIEMEEVAERKFKGDELKFDILRERQPMSVVVKLKPCWPFLIQANAHDVRPRFVLFGGLLFEPLCRDFLEAFGIDDLRVRYFYDSFVSRALFVDHPEVIVLGAVLKDPVNTYFDGFRNGIVDKVNDQPIRRLEDLAAAFAEPRDYYVIQLIHEGRPIVLERKAVEAARERIKRAYNVTL
ncbi:MAG: trypsin-like peptidase domain-containing protein, partial [Verrucomicrobia bacterium]|nr:trypsin-like peptidase domain-containing protein [Verrucomicrobiota bacterium]